MIGIDTIPLVRDGRDGDAEQLIRLMGDVFAEYPGCVLDVDGEEPDLRAIATAYAGYGGRFWVAEAPSDGRIVGMVGGRPLGLAGGHWELKKLYVDRSARGTGLGTRLVRLVEAEAARRGAPVLELWSDTRFHDAHRLYERLGYRRGTELRELHDLSDSVEYHFSKPVAVSKETRSLVRILEHHGITVVLDVGANVGQYATRLRHGGYDGRIVSFEPLPEARTALARAAAGDPSWQVAPQAALGAMEGAVTLNVSAESDMSSTLPFRPEMGELLDSAAYTGSVTVPITRLDEVFDTYVAPGDRCFLKIDTQGSESAVLEGAADRLDRISCIQLELSIVPVYQGEPGFLDMIDRLARLGFQPALFIPGYFNRRTARMISMDGVFVSLSR
ncbi:bifunctional GNAT family N-acetyltransferase/class I SAM-dependent methyltransferase [Skermanella mucosa]|uniref:bifunctional GNAT family N-acetyltransferase/class I SAM-dependent methyltransferase n=1 Tax=Skermanella mucosa TaxID=1789672 RepID=UPI00192C2786|nr:bifunctional GNAT family N-acetyltransferase/class I SAM-dependent methyltransferase [Skermanella mucosa]UEM18877.1 bifunctional GNAT family N-acetyltransferase/class I SAM-dependent methyltransferase [Skermanella mucosa]